MWFLCWMGQIMKCACITHTLRVWSHDLSGVLPDVLARVRAVLVLSVVFATCWGSQWKDPKRVWFFLQPVTAVRIPCVLDSIVELNKAREVEELLGWPSCLISWVLVRLACYAMWQLAPPFRPHEWQVEPWLQFFVKGKMNDPERCCFPWKLRS